MGFIVNRYSFNKTKNSGHVPIYRREIYASVRTSNRNSI